MTEAEKRKYYPCRAYLNLTPKQRDMIFNENSPDFQPGAYEAFGRMEREKIAGTGGYVYFMKNYMPGFAPKGGKIMPFDEWEFQEEIIWPMIENRIEYIDAKTRRAGETTSNLGDFYRDARFVDEAINSNLIYTAHTQAIAKKFMRKFRAVDRYVKATAPWLDTDDNQLGEYYVEGKKKKGENNVYTVTFPGREIMIEAAGPGGALRSEAARTLIFDELANYEKSADPEATYTAGEAICEGGGIKRVISSARGKTGKAKKFYDLYMGALAGENDFTPIFISRLEHPWYQKPGWFERKVAGSSYIKACHEYPATIEEAFMANQEGAAFPGDHIDSACELGAFIKSKDIEGQGRGGVGVDWGYNATGIVHDKELPNLGMWINKAWTLRMVAASDSPARIMPVIEKLVSEKSYYCYDPGGAGSTYDAEWQKKYRRKMRTCMCPFGEFKGDNIAYIQGALARTHREWQAEKELAEKESREPDLNNLFSFIAIDKKECPQLVEDLFEARMEDGTLVKKSSDSMHELDAFIARVTPYQEKWQRKSR